MKHPHDSNAQANVLNRCRLMKVSFVDKFG